MPPRTPQAPSVMAGTGLGAKDTGSQASLLARSTLGAPVLIGLHLCS